MPVWRTAAEARAVLAPLLDLPVVRTLHRAAGDRELHLVGGTLRDRLLGRPHRDLDAVVAGHGAAVAERLARALAARVVPLGHEGLVSYRVARRDLVVDLWDRGQVPLSRDLRRRDFTINALALEVPGGRLVDPLGGLEDLTTRRLRLPSPEVLDEDPLRVLRLVRLAAELGFRSTPEALEAARLRCAALTEVAGERVRHELELALHVVPAAPTFDLLRRLEVHPGLLLGDPSLEVGAERACFERADDLLGERGSAALAEVDPLLLHWSLLLGSLDADPAAAAVHRLRRLGWVGRRTARELATLAAWRELPDDAGARRWFIHRLGRLWPTAAVAAASLSTASPLEDRRAALEELARLADAEGPGLADPPPLMAAEEVMELTGLPPGPALGGLLERLRRRQIEGELADADAARRWLRDAEHTRP